MTKLIHFRRKWKPLRSKMNRMTDSNHICTGTIQNTLYYTRVKCFSFSWIVKSSCFCSRLYTITAIADIDLFGGMTKAYHCAHALLSRVKSCTTHYLRPKGYTYELPRCDSEMCKVICAPLPLSVYVTSSTVFAFFILYVFPSYTVISQ